METPAMLLALSLAALALFLAAAATDARTRRIPNELCLALAAAGLGRIAFELVAGGAVVPAAADVGAAAVVFLAGAVAFGAGLLGGGDVKLLAAGTVWVGAAALLPFLMVTALAGGVLAAAFLALAFLRREGGRVALPYGIAIAAGGIVATGSTVWG
jgi:prepilin peptidase CpaA